MRTRLHRIHRRGAVLPLVAVCLIGLIGLVALAIDIGMVAVARTQAQTAADSSAMAGARTLSGNSASQYNYDSVSTNAIKAANANFIFGKKIEGDPNTNWDPKDAEGNSDAEAKAKVHPADHIYMTGQVKVEIGAYAFSYDDDPTSNPYFDPNNPDYDTSKFDASKEGFKVQIPRTDSDEPYSAVRSTVTFQGDYSFGRIFGLNKFDVVATATAVHRPRDVVIVMDLSGSMRFQSLVGIPYNGARTTSMNPDPYYPKFGHYSDTTAAALFGNSSIPTGGSEYYDPANVSVETNSGPAILKEFYKHTAPGAPNVATDLAFSRSSNGFDEAPGGDNFLKTSGDTGSNYASTVNGVVGGTSKNIDFETNGYGQYRESGFSGYTEGPGYWGKTFVIWPPDPRGPASDKDPNNTAHHADNGSKDWRQRFFFKYNPSTSTLGWLDHNNLLWATSAGTNPAVRLPQSSTSVTEIVNGVSTTVSYQYRINYAAIVKWLSESPSHFPTQIRAGRIKYYDALPDHTDVTLNNRWWTTQTLTDLNERFWREYIDFVLGLQATGTSGSGYVTYSAGSGTNPLTARIGNGDFYTWGTFQIAQKPYPNLGTPSQKSPTGPRINKSGGYSAGATTLAIDNISSAVTLPALALIGSNYYTVTGTPTSTSITLTSGLLGSVSDNTSFSFRNVSGNSAINNSGGYATGATSINVSNIPAGYMAGDAVRITHDGKQLYYYLDAAPTPSVGPTTLTLKSPGLLYSAANGDAVEFVSVDQTRYMDYNDNPRRARSQYWFGPLTWVDWLGNYNTGKFAWPGNIHEAQNWACKVGIQSAIDDIKNNHPSDFIGLCYFSSPVYSSGGSGQFNAPSVPLGRNYQQLKDALWFPPSTIVGGKSEITPYDSDFRNVPRAQGGTSPGMGFMLAYNLLSSSYSNLRSYPQPQSSYRGAIGGLGRRGAARLVIFETDGAPNTASTASLEGSGKDRYYKIRVYNPADLGDDSNEEWPSGPSYSNTDVYTVVEQICKLDTDGGHATKRKPVQVYSIGYGSLFDPDNSGTTQNNALTFLQTVQKYGNTATTTNYLDFPSDQRIYGPNEGTDGRIDRMQKAFTKIMQAGVQVSLIE